MRVVIERNSITHVRQAVIMSVALTAAAVGGPGMVGAISTPEPEATQQQQQKAVTSCDRLLAKIDDAEYRIRAFRDAQSQVVEAQLDPRFDAMARQWQEELAGMIADYDERCIPH
jgi:hypothetical protein